MKTILLIIACLTNVAVAASLTVKDVGPAADPKRVEFRGVGASDFDPAIWQAGKLHLLSDARRPLLAPQDGRFRNIYAPSVFPMKNGWRIYYGGWDGTSTGNDRIYLTETANFLTFSARQTVIEHGDFTHVCNVNAIAVDRGFAMVCTAYPNAKGLNKPVTFFSDDGVHFNGASGAFRATSNQIVTIDGYEKYADADINGLNVLLHESGSYRLYFANFRDFGKTYRASSADGKLFTFDGKVLDGAVAVNDVKRFRIADADWYVMGMHMNGEQLYYSISRDGMKFPEAKTLAVHDGEDDRYIVAIGFVVDLTGRKLMGFFYGAGAVGSLDQNRIFAKWLQKKIVFRGSELTAALGPDRQSLGIDAKTSGKLELLGDDGVTLLGTIDDVALTPGRAYEVGLPGER